MDFINDFTLSKKQKKYLKALVKKIKSIMPCSLYQHSIDTLQCAGAIAKKYLTDINFFNLSVSCILHDYGKIFSYEKLVEIVKEDKLEISDFELNSPSLIHGFIGDYLVSRDFKIYDKEILRAIKYHTIGYCNMGLEDKILFIADKIEESRNYDGVAGLRELALKDINLCLLEVYKSTIIYVVGRGKLLHPDTSRIWNNICGGI